MTSGTLARLAVEAIGAYVAQVRSGAFPTSAQAYKPNAALRTRTEDQERLRFVDLDTPLPLDHWH